MRKQIITMFIMAACAISGLSGQIDSFSKEDATAFLECFVKNGGVWKEGRSSVLIEKNKPETEYESNKVWDGNLSTAWVEGAIGAGIGEYVTIDIEFLSPLSLRFDKIFSNIKIKGKLKINNGFCKSAKLFKDNNRVKKALITIYAVPIRFAQIGTFALKPGPMKLKEFEIHIADTSELQVFDFDAEIRPCAEAEGYVALFLRLTILDVYPGEKYDDTCISELYATAELD